MNEANNSEGESLGGVEELGWLTVKAKGNERHTGEREKGGGRNSEKKVHEL